MRAWIRRTPAAQAAWLEWTGPRRRRHVVATIAGVALALAVGAWCGARAGEAARLLLSHPWIVAGAAAAFGTVTTSARRARGHAARTRAWTGALPVAAHDARWAERLYAAATAIVAAALVTAFAAGMVASASVAGPIAAPPDPAAIARPGGATLLALWAGLSAGVAYALTRRIEDAPPPPPGSRYVPRAAARAWRAPPTLAPLAAWPIRAAFVRAQPRAASRAMLPVLLLMPAGLPLAQAVGTLTIAILGLALVAILAGTREAVAAAVAWLAPLPVRRTAVSLATVRTALLATVGAATAVVALGWAVTA